MYLYIFHVWETSENKKIKIRTRIPTDDSRSFLFFFFYSADCLRFCHFAILGRFPSSINRADPVETENRQHRKLVTRRGRRGVGSGARKFSAEFHEPLPEVVVERARTSIENNVNVIKKY